MPPKRLNVVTGNEAERRAQEGQGIAGAQRALGHVNEAMRHERDKDNQAALREAARYLREVKERTPATVKSRALHRV